MQLREYQSDAIAKIRNAFAKGSKRICFQLPTGGGKTILAAFMIKNAVEKGNKVLFLVHLRELIEQTSEKLKLIGIKHGVIASGYTYHDSPVQIAMIQTLSRRLGKVNLAPSFIIVDECQHSCSNSYKNLIAQWPNAMIVGLTATPVRLDGKGLGDVFDTLVEGPKPQELMDIGHLAGYKLYAPNNDLDLSDVQITAGDYQSDQLTDALGKSHITGDAIEHYKRLLPGKKALVFCASIAHSKKVCEDFNAAGIPATHLDGTTKKEERNRIITDFRSGRIRVLCNCSLISEGFDVPDCDGVILLRPTKSLGMYLQQIGRALRPQENKTAIILDHVHNVMEHGLPNEEREWSLQTRKKRKSNKEKVTGVTICKKCFNVYEQRKRSCPLCNTEREIAKREIEEVEGELVEITSTSKFKSNHIGLLAKHCHSLEELKALGKSLGYKPGWAHFRWIARQKRK